MAPQLHPDQLDEALPGNLGPGDTLDTVLLCGAKLGDHKAPRVHIVESALIDCAADLLDTAGATFSEALVSQCRFTTWELRDASLRDVTLERCRFGALQADGAYLADLEVVGSRIDYVGLREARLRRVTFRDCVIGTIDLSGTDVMALADPTALRGLTLSDEQVALHAWRLAAHLGVVPPHVEDVHDS